MAPALLYLPPLLGVGVLDMRQVTGLTITQGLFACLSGVIRHDRYRQVHRRLVLYMGGPLLLGALAGALLSGGIANEALMVLFSALALAAALLMALPLEEREGAEEASAYAFPVPLAVGIALAIGLLGGMVGQGGSFLLIPLMLHTLRLPTRVVIGSNLALVLFSSLAGFAGKAATGQVPFYLAVFLVAGALPGAQLGSVLSRRTPPRWLRLALAVVIGVAALGIAADAFANR